VNTLANTVSVEIEKVKQASVGGVQGAGDDLKKLAKQAQVDAEEAARRAQAIKKLEDALAALGHRPEDIRRVINTHLHFDHAGGNLSREGLSFPSAQYIVQRRELDFARHTNERTAGSYLAPNFEGIPFQLIDGETEILPGIRGLPTPGHVPYHQSILIQSAGETACFVADLVPTSAHLPLPWIMGYDLEPLVTLETRRRIYQRAEAEGWLLVFEHDPHVVSGRLAREEKGFGLVEQRVLG